MLYLPCLTLYAWILIGHFGPYRDFRGRGFVPGFSSSWLSREEDSSLNSELPPTSSSEYSIKGTRPIKPGSPTFGRADNEPTMVSSLVKDVLPWEQNIFPKNVSRSTLLLPYLFCSLLSNHYVNILFILKIYHSILYYVVSDSIF